MALANITHLHSDTPTFMRPCLCYPDPSSSGTPANFIGRCYSSFFCLLPTYTGRGTMVFQAGYLHNSYTEFDHMVGPKQHLVYRWTPQFVCRFPFVTCRDHANHPRRCSVAAGLFGQRRLSQMDGLWCNYWCCGYPNIHRYYLFPYHLDTKNQNGRLRTQRIESQCERNSYFSVAVDLCNSKNSWALFSNFICSCIISTSVT